MQPLPTARSFFRRSSRYAKAFLWLLKQQFKASPGAFVLTILSGLANRLGSIVVFITTVKCGLWLLKPESVPKPVAQLFGNVAGSSEFIGGLLIIPTIVVVCVALSGVVYSKVRMRVVARCGDAIAVEDGRRKIVAEAEALSGRERPPQAVRSLVTLLLDDWAALYRLQGNLIKLIVVISTFLIAVGLAAFIDPIVTAVVVSLAIIVAVVIVWRQHGASYVLTEERAQRRIMGAERTAELVEKVDRALASSADISALEDSIRRRHRDVMADYQLRERGDTVSRLAIDIGMGVMIFVILGTLYLREMSMNATQIAYVLILLVVLRFVMAQVRGIAQHAMALSKDYRCLVAIAGLASANGGRPAFHDVVLDDDGESRL